LQALRKKGNNLPEEDIQRIIRDADIDGDGTIDYEEFIAATINQNKLEREEHLKKAFEHFDLNGDGMISHDELVQVWTWGVYGEGVGKSSKCGWHGLKAKGHRAGGGEVG